MNPEALATVLTMITLPDEAFFALDAPATAALQGRVAQALLPPPLTGPPSRGADPPPELRAIAIPREVDWGRRASFPMLLAEVRSHQREWEVNAGQNRLVVISNLVSGEVIVSPPDLGRRLEVQPPSRSGPPPDALNMRLASIGVVRFDLQRWFQRQQLLGHLAVTVVDYDLPSNTVTVHAWGPGVTPPGGVLAGGATRIEPAFAAGVPAADGVTMTLPDTVSAVTPAVLHSEVRLPRTRAATVDAPPRAPHPLVLAATLMLVKLDQPLPVLIDLAVPAESDAAGNVAAAFHLDLGGALAGRVTTGAWLVYLVVGDTLTGPRMLEVTQL